MSTLVIGLVCEDHGHFSAVTRLVDAALVAGHGWLDGILYDCRRWRGLADDERWYKYDPADANDLRPIVLDGRRVAPHGHIGGVPLKPEAGMWRRALMLLCHCEPLPDVVVLARDLDGYPERREGIDQVVANLPWPFKIAVAAPQPEIEAWFVSGFVPADPTEQAQLAALCSELSFDPTLRSERLTSHPNDAPTDAKRVLSRLCGAAAERRGRCLDDRALLHRRGAANGLSAFLGEVDAHIVPALR